MSLFGAMPFPVQFFLAFVIVLGLIGLTAWAVRRFGAGRLGGMGARGRQPRLAVVDYASVDGRRRLILVRRDNIEHLVMIGGPSDIVVESNIVRATPAPREVPVVRQPTVPEPLPRAIAPPDAAANVSWLQQPEPASAAPPVAARAPRVEPAAEEPPPAPLQPQAEPQPRAPRETLAALADELSTKPAAAPRSRPQAVARPPATEPRPEPRISIPQPASDEAAADQSLAEMAHQLEAALRKPAARSDRPEAREPRAPAAPRVVTPSEQAAPAQPPPPAPPPPTLRAARTPDVKPPRAEAKPSSPSKTLYDSLEQEMASLLGRSTAKN
jgi:flagellar protein FliO/FliZ